MMDGFSFPFSGLKLEAGLSDGDKIVATALAGVAQ